MKTTCTDSLQRPIRGIFIVFSLLVCLLFRIPQAAAGSDTAENIGDWLQYLLPAAGLVGTYAADDPEGRKQWMKGVGGSVVTTWALKAAYGKMRPTNDSLTSFPSGHTTAAFAGAGFIDARYGHGWGSLAYAGAAFTGWSRINADKHYADDVLAGMSVALFNTWAWVTPQHQSVSLQPIAADNGVGVMINVTDPRYAKKEKVKKGQSRPKFIYTADFGTVFLLRNKISSPGTGGTSFNLADFDKRDDPMTSAQVSVEWLMKDQHRLGVWIWPFESRDTKHLSSPISFGGNTYAAGSDIVSSYRHYKVDVLYSYDVFPRSRWILMPSAGATLQWTDIRLANANGTQVAEVDDKVILPLAGITAGYKFGAGLKILGGVTGMVLSDDRYLDTHAEVRYRFNRYWELGAGAGYYARDIETSDLKENADHASLFVSLNYTFY